MLLRAPTFAKLLGIALEWNNYPVVRFEVIARDASPMAVIRAKAGKLVTYGCGIHTSYQNEDGVTIR